MVPLLNGRHLLMKLFPILLFFLLTFIGFAQTKTYVGVKLGGHASSSFMNHTVFGFNARLGFQPGFNAGILVKHFPRRKSSLINAGIQGGVNYIQRGWVQSFFDPSIDNYSVRMNYIEIPIEGVGYFGNENKYFIAAGFYTEVLLKAKKDPDPTGITVDDFATYVADRDREIGYGGRLSGGVFRDFSFGSLHLEGFFSYSFSNFIDAGDLTNDQLPDISNLWNLGVSIGYLIPYGKLELSP